MPRRPGATVCPRCRFEYGTAADQASPADVTTTAPATRASGAVCFLRFERVCAAQRSDGMRVLSGCALMWSRNKPKPDSQEAAHIERIKAMPCVICGEFKDAASEAHEIEQGQWFTSIPLCADCHRGSLNGIHGQRVMWKVMKQTELGALNETIRRLVA